MYYVFRVCFYPQNKFYLFSSESLKLGMREFYKLLREVDFVYDKYYLGVDCTSD